MKRVRWITVLALVGATLAACGSTRREPRTHRVEIRGMQFVPANLVVAVGDTIVWTNTDIVPHTATSSTPSAATFDSHQLASQQQWQYVVKVAGDYAYTCTYHPTMHGTLVAR